MLTAVQRKARIERRQKRRAAVASLHCTENIKRCKRASKRSCAQYLRNLKEPVRTIWFDREYIDDPFL